MRTLICLGLCSAVLAVASCTRPATEPAPNASTPAPQASAAAQTASTPHPNQVPVTMGKVSATAAALNPRVVEAYSVETVTLEGMGAGPPTGFPGAPESKAEAAPEGLKWVIVLVDVEAPKGEFSIPLNKIRLTDQSKESYRLVSFGGTPADSFADLREYDKYKMVEPPKMVMRSDKPSKQKFLFAVRENAAGLALDF